MAVTAIDRKIPLLRRGMRFRLLNTKPIRQDAFVELIERIVGLAGPLYRRRVPR